MLENPELQEFTLSITWECIGQVKVCGENINDSFEQEPSPWLLE